LLTGIIFLVSLLTYVIPSGAYVRETRKVGTIDRTLVIPGTFQEIPKHYSLRGAVLGEVVEGKSTPVSFHGFLTAIPRGMEAAADIIFFIFIIGGVFGILQRTGTIAAAIHKLLDVFGKSSGTLTVAIMVCIAIGGSTLGMGEEFIPLVPLFLMISKRMGLDRIYGLAIVMLAAEVGFAAGMTNPFTINIAQGIAELPINSGLGFRMVFFACCVTLTLVYVLRYGARVKRNPAASLMVGDEFDLSEHGLETHAFSRSHLAVLVACAATFVLILVAVRKLDWWLPDMAGGFFLMGLLAAILCRLPVAEATKAFVKGMEDMVVAALVVGFARGIEVVLQDGQILDTVIHSAALVLVGVPRYVSAEGMLLFQTMLNFFIPSGSGQAAVTMPLMAPLSDVLGVTRQTAVFAFQCGDGFSNTIVPTSGVLMAMLSLAGIPYEKWLRFVLPLFAQLMVLSAVFLVVAMAIGYS
jgi:uncharacterized ion transporter superfamily protein YfcC